LALSNVAVAFPDKAAVTYQEQQRLMRLRRDLRFFDFFPVAVDI